MNLELNNKKVVVSGAANGIDIEPYEGSEVSELVDPIVRYEFHQGDASDERI